MVEYHGHGRPGQGDSGDEPGHHGDVGARGSQRREYFRVDGPDAVKGDRKSTEQNDRIVVSVVAGQPGHLGTDPFRPLRQDRCLAVAGRGDRGDDRRPGRGQPLD
jgi:hypothetical protein